MKKLVGALFGLALASFGFAEDRVYTMKTYTLGTLDRATPANSTMVTTQDALFIPGMTLDQFVADKYAVYGIFCGRSVGAAFKSPVGMYSFQPHLDEAGSIDRAIGIMCLHEDPYTKGVTLEFTNGPDGLHVKGLYASYINWYDWNYKFTQLLEDGTYKRNGNNSTLATSFDAQAYGVCGLRASLFIPASEPLTIWTNPAGEPVLTLDDIQGYTFTAYEAGSSIDLKGARVNGYNTRLERGADGSVERIVTEFQLLDDRYIKGVIVELTNGPDGVQAKALAARYFAVANGASLGDVMMNADGTFNGTGAPVASSYSTGNYGLYELMATPPAPSVELVLDRTQTWSELTAGVDLGARDLVVNVKVTGTDAPVLTFDTPIDRVTMNFIGTEGATTASLVQGAGCTAFTVDQLNVTKELRLGLDVALAPAAVDVASGTRLVYQATGEATVASQVTGGGGVEVASGVLTFNAAQSSYTGGTWVKAGATVKPGRGAVAVGTMRLGPFGMASAGNAIHLEAGAVYDVNGIDRASCWVEVASDEAIVNSGEPRSMEKAQMHGLILAADVTLTPRSTYSIVTPDLLMPGSLVLNGHTLTIMGEDTLFAMRTSDNAITGAGTIEVAEGCFYFDSSQVNAPQATLQIEPEAVVTNRANMNWGRIVNNGTFVFDPQNNSNQVYAAACEGAGTYVKTGPNRGNMTFAANADRIFSTYVVEQGTLGVWRSIRGQGNPYGFITDDEPDVNTLVDVKPGATFDLGGALDLNATARLAGEGVGGRGALVNTGAAIGTGKSQLTQIIVAEDALVGGTAEFGLLGPGYAPTRLDLRDKTLTTCNPHFFLRACTITGTGTLAVTNGLLEFLAGTTVQDAFSLYVGPNGSFKSAIDVAVRDFASYGTFANAPRITASGTVTATGVAVPRLALADGATVAIADLEAPLAVSQELTGTGVVTLDLEGLVPSGASTPLFAAPAGTNLAGVTFKGVHVPNGYRISRVNTLPHLSRSGLEIFLR